MRKKSILCLSVVAVIVIIVTLSCNVAVNSNSAGRTFDSAREVPKNFFNQDSVIVISQKLHNQRGIYLADHIGIDAIGYNAADVNIMAAYITHAREILARVKLVLSLLYL